MLSLAGGVLGLALGVLGIRALLQVNTAGLPRVGETARRSASTGGCWASPSLVSLGTGVLFGLIPALQSSRTDLTTTLKESSGRSGTGFRQNKARSILVVTEVALALVLLVGSALLIRTAVALAHVNPGFDATNVLTMRMSLTGPRFQERAGRRADGRGTASSGCRRCPASSRPAPPAACRSRRLRPALHHRRPAAAGAGSLPRRRRLDDGVAGLLRGLQDPGQARPHLHRARHGHVAAGGDHQRGDGEAVLGRQAIR